MRISKSQDITKTSLQLRTRSPSCTQNKPKINTSPACNKTSTAQRSENSPQKLVPSALFHRYNTANLEAHRSVLFESSSLTAAAWRLLKTTRRTVGPPQERSVYTQVGAPTWRNSPEKPSQRAGPHHSSLEYGPTT